jgi:hypothetical protein
MKLTRPTNHEVRYSSSQVLAVLAQSVERRSRKAKVAGSNPAGGSSNRKNI